jgi:hypothetical protein
VPRKLRLGEVAGLRNVLGIDLDELVFGRPPGSAESRLEALARRLSEVGPPAAVELLERLMEFLLLLQEEPGA